MDRCAESRVADHRWDTARRMAGAGARDRGRPQQQPPNSGPAGPCAVRRGAASRVERAREVAGGEAPRSRERLANNKRPDLQADLEPDSRPRGADKQRKTRKRSLLKMG